jgi:hypothetical protein
MRRRRITNEQQQKKKKKHNKKIRQKEKIRPAPFRSQSDKRGKDVII